MSVRTRLALPAPTGHGSVMGSAIPVVSSAPSSALMSVSYQRAMEERVTAYGPSATVQRVLAEKVKEVAAQRMRTISAPTTIGVIEDDFREAVIRLRALEAHAFSIRAPASLAPDTLSHALSSNQSIMRHCVRSPGELMQLVRVFKAPTVRSIVPLTVERLVQHNLIRRFVLDFCLKDELSVELSKVIKPLAMRALREDGRFKNMGMLRTELEGQALHYLETGDKGGIDPRLVAIVEELNKQATEAASGLSASRIRAAVAMRAADLCIETFVQKIINEYDLSSAPELAGYKARPPQTHETRRYFMINGGVASGKSSAKQLQDDQARHEGVDPTTVCPINRDAFKPMLLDRGEVAAEYREFFASFTEDEAFLLRDAILRDYQARLRANTAPHIYIDQVSPTIEMLRMAGSRASRGLDLTVVYSPVELSFCMANYRERETGYGAVTAGLLNTHAVVSTQIIENIEQARREGCDHIRLRIVANVARGVLMPVACVDYRHGIGEVQDRDRLLAFFHKKHISRDARRFAEIYPPDLAASGSCDSCAPMVGRLMDRITPPRRVVSTGSASPSVSLRSGPVEAAPPVRVSITPGPGDTVKVSLSVGGVVVGGPG